MAVILTKKIIETSLFDKSEDYSEIDFSDIVLKFLKDLSNPEEYKYEEDFKDTYAYILSRKFNDLTEVETISLTDDGHCQWRIDIVIKMNQQYIPIELKFRHNEQSTNGYASDFIEDVHRINELINMYDDIPCGYAICLTNNNDFVNDCDNEIEEYDKSDRAILFLDNVIDWESIKNGYKVGLVSRYKTDYRRKNPTQKSFVQYWNNKNSKI